MLSRVLQALSTKQTYKPYLLTIALFLLFCMGFFLRLYDVSTQSYWMDEGYTVNAILSIKERGTTTLDSGIYYSCPTYCYPTAYLVQIFGDDPASYRLLSVVAGSLLILVIFTVAKTFFNLKIAIISTVLTTFSYLNIAWSRQARWYTLFALFFWLAIFCFYHGMNQGRHQRKYQLAAFIFTSLTIATHELGILLPVIFASWLAIDWYLKKVLPLSRQLLGTCLVLMVSSVVLAEYYFSFLSNLSLHYVLPYYVSYYLQTYIVFIILTIFGVFLLFKTYKKQYIFFYAVLMIYLIPLGFLTDLVQYRYLFHLTPIIFIGSAIGIIGLYDLCSQYYQKILLAGSLMILALSSSQIILLPQSLYFLESDDPARLNDRPFYAYTPQPNWSAAYAYLASVKQADHIVISSQPQFNKIFLGKAGYFIHYDHLGRSPIDGASTDTHDRYVGAQIINTTADLIKLQSTQHGFILFDTFATNNRIDPEILNYITTHFTLVFTEKTNAMSEIFVYQF